jgi:hypothetical protein
VQLGVALSAGLNVTPSSNYGVRTIRGKQKWSANDSLQRQLSTWAYNEMSHGSSSRLKALQKATKEWRNASDALMRAYETGVSGFERARLGKEVQRTTQVYLDLLATITGEPPTKLKPPPLGEALVPKKR